MKKNFFRLLSLFACLCLIFGSLSMVACNGDAADATEAPTTDAVEENDELVEVIRVIDDIKYGGKFTNDRLAVVKVSKDAVPEGAISDMSEIRNKYSTAPLYSGDYITAEKVTKDKPKDAVDEDEENIEETIDPDELGYVIITRYESLVEGKNYSPAIKKAIEENPGRTIYFPDGTYNIQEPIVMPADPAKSVSFRLSHLAVITATDWADKTLPMIRMGVEETAAAPAAEGEDAPLVDMDDANLSEQRSCYIIGGCIFANRQASGISIEGGKDNLLYNVSIKSAYNGIHVLYGNNELGATYANVDNVNITGYEATGSAGILVEGTRNTFSNMRIASVQYGVMCTATGEANIFRNLHPLTCGMNDVIKVDENGKRLEENNGRHTVGFYDKSDGNNFDVCYSDQMASGYMFSENCRTVAIGGFCYWWTEANDYHVGYESEGKFNALVVAGKVSLSAETTTDTYLMIGEEGGQGVVIAPIGERTNKFSYMLQQHLAK